MSMEKPSQETGAAPVPRVGMAHPPSQSSAVQTIPIHYHGCCHKGMRFYHGSTQRPTLLTPCACWHTSVVLVPGHSVPESMGGKPYHPSRLSNSQTSRDESADQRAATDARVTTHGSESNRSCCWSGRAVPMFFRRFRTFALQTWNPGHPGTEYAESFTTSWWLNEVLLLQTCLRRGRPTCL